MPLVLVVPFINWLEAFPCRTEKVQVVIKVLNAVIPKFRLPRGTQSDNGSSFKATVTQEDSRALGI